jgi:hypothetical protein
VYASRRLVSEIAHGTSGNARHDPQQVPSLGISVKHFRHFPDSSRQSGRGDGQNSGDFGKSSLRHGRHSLGYHRKQFARGHADQREEVLRSLIFTLRFCRQLAQVLHHGVRIDFADGADLILQFVLALELVLAFPEQPPKKVFTFPKDASEKVFAFPEYASEELFTFPEQASEEFFTFQFVFRLVFKFFFELILEFSFQLTFICHDESSCEGWSNLTGRLWLTHCIAPAPRCETPTQTPWPTVGAADLAVAPDGGSASLRAAEHAPNLSGEGACRALAGELETLGALPLQALHCAAHNSWHRSNSHLGTPAAAENPG